MTAKSKTKKQTKLIVREIFLILIYAALGTLLLEAMLGNPFAIKFPILLYNIATHALFLFAIRQLSLKLNLASRIYLVLVWLFGTANFLIIAFRSTPLMPWDIYSWQTALNVVSNYTLPFSWPYILTSLGFILLFLSTFHLDKLLKLPKLKKSSKEKILLALLSLILVFSSLVITQSDFIRDNLNFHTTLFNSRGMSKANGHLVNFIFTGRYLKVDKPENYSKERVEEIFKDIAFKDFSRTSVGEKYLSTNKSTRPLDKVQLANKFQPDIIVVMNESFADLQDLKDFETNKDYMPFFRNFSDNAKKGTTYASVIGGNTASSEFEFLTGMTMGFLPSGSIAYMQYINKPMTSIVSLLEDRNYESLAMHPYKASGWNRPKVYDYLGFDQVKFEDDFVHKNKLRNYISDEALFSEILMELDDDHRSDQAKFIFAVSMQNHGGYSELFHNFEPDVEAKLDGSSPALNQYLSLVKETDKNLRSFIEELEKRERPTIVLFFGDHQPNDFTVSKLTAGLDDDCLEENRRKTKYLLWANYPLSDTKEEAYSINYLANLLLKEAHIPFDKWYSFLANVRAKTPVINDAFYRSNNQAKINSITGEALPSHLNDYAILQYDYLFGDSFDDLR